MIDQHDCGRVKRLFRIIYKHGELYWSELKQYQIHSFFQSQHCLFKSKNSSSQFIL